MLNSKDRRTMDINDEVSRCDNISELKEILIQNSSYYSDWKRYINRLMEKSHMNYVQMAKRCHCSRNTVKKWCREGAIPQNRETFLKIGFAFRLEYDEFDMMLKRYGKYSGLYAKNMSDAICIFVINHYPDNEHTDAYECYLQCKEYLLMSLRQTDGCIVAPKDTFQIEEELLGCDSREEFEKFILDNRASYQQTFSNLIAFLELLISKKGENMHRFAQYNELDFSYEKMISALRLKRECPDRLRLILLGVNMNLSLEDINYMLSLAYMESMCAKDKLECIIMYVVEDAYLNNPPYMYESAMVLQHYENDPKLQNRCKDILNKYWETKEDNKSNIMDKRIPNYIENGLSDYLRYVLSELDWEDETIYKYI